MSQEQTHDNCKYFSYKKCPEINTEIMKLATQDIPPSPTGAPTTLSPPPTKEEIDKICNECDSFTQK